MRLLALRLSDLCPLVGSGRRGATCHKAAPERTRQRKDPAIPPHFPAFSLQLTSHPLF
ncbi:hypothetical protein KCP71_10170 [Salmonella enterica subsp. enterica]|nr:hypothetical protein KCP71_10170 [Salmonella enterica subsp. enterica]